MVFLQLPILFGIYLFFSSLSHPCPHYTTVPCLHCAKYLFSQNHFCCVPDNVLLLDLKRNLFFYLIEKMVRVACTLQSLDCFLALRQMLTGCYLMDVWKALFFIGKFRKVLVSEISISSRSHIPAVSQGSWDLYLLLGDSKVAWHFVLSRF